MRLDELSSVVRRSSRTTEDSSSRRIMRLVPVFTLQTNNQTNNECLLCFFKLQIIRGCVVIGQKVNQ